ncbi:hypothetical protein AAKU55_001881 [Oxalobacteraceae bacterium GrIS 1.11]
MNIFIKKSMKFFQIMKSSIGAMIFAALLITVFVLTLALLMFFSQTCADALGYELVISEDLAKTVIACGGAIAVGFLALYGVQQQTFSAEKRHKVDSSLALKKEIFLQVAEAAAVQYQYLVSFASRDFKDTDRKHMAQEIGKAFFKLQMVASQETIFAMLDANVEWTRAIYYIDLLGPIPLNGTGARIQEIQKYALPFMKKLWRFNIISRKEIECTFADDDFYLRTMEEKNKFIV